MFLSGESSPKAHNRFMKWKIGNLTGRNELFLGRRACEQPTTTVEVEEIGDTAGRNDSSP
jgi:hypothetical protein